MTRREAREAAFKLVFSKSINDQPLSEMYSDLEDCLPELDDFAKLLAERTLSNLAAIDDLISANLVGWSIGRIPKVSLALLRISAAQLLYFEDIPDSVVINEAVELAKLYGSDDEYVFINGALRGILTTVRSGSKEQ